MPAVLPVQLVNWSTQFEQLSVNTKSLSKRENLLLVSIFLKGLPSGSDRKESACNEGDPGSIPGPGRSPGEGNGNPLQYSCLENPHGEEPDMAIVHGVVKSQTPLSD